MTRKKIKSLKLIKKKSVVPSILFFSFAIFIEFIILSGIWGMFLLYILNSKVQIERERSSFARDTLMATYAETGNLQEAIQSTIEVCDGQYTFSIIDGNGTLIGNCGDPTYNLDSYTDYGIYESDVQSFYLDRNTKETWILKQDGDFNFPVWELFDVMINNYNINDNADIPSQRVYIWLNTNLPQPIDITDATDSEVSYTILNKAVIGITKGDVSFMLSFLLITIIALFVPTFVTFINIIMSIGRQRKVSKLIYLDQLTGGKNWMYFKHKAIRMLTGFRSQRQFYIMVDLQFNKYRNYCSCHGVKEGQEALQIMDDVITKSISRRDLATHYANAGFGLLIRCEGPQEGIEKVQKLQDKLATVFAKNKITFHSGIYCIDPEEYKSVRDRKKRIDIDQMYNNAGIARGASQKSDENDVIVFNQEMLAQRLWEHKVEENMDAALKNEEFAVYIQPKYHPSTGELKGAEALVRWISPTEGFISPGRFIPIFEKNGFITKLDDYMLSHVAKLQADWIAEGKSVVPISVNVSRAHFTDPHLAEHICSLVDQYQTPHHVIEIELTESAFFDDKEALLNTVKKLKELGFEISMDDFGAGYSSLNSLKDLPLDVLKLDAEFFRGDLSDKRGEIVVSEAIALAKSLNMRIVAEGIEKKEQVEFLAGLGCDMIQGYYFAKPMPVNEYEEKAFG